MSIVHIRNQSVRPAPAITRLAALCIWSCLMAATLAAAENAAEIKIDDNHSLITPVQYKNLTVWQVSAKTVENLDNLVALQQAQADKTVEIRETGEGGEVNTLVIENKGDKTILVLAGTIVKGGKQDRQIGQDFVIGPGVKLNVDSFCVEHGRWTTQRQAVYHNETDDVGAREVLRGAGRVGPQPADSATQMAVQPNATSTAQADQIQGTDALPRQEQNRNIAAVAVQDQVEAQAQPQPRAAPDLQKSIDTEGKFEAQASMANSSVRTKGQYAANQQEVWDEVAKTNTSAGAAPATGTLVAAKEMAAENPDRKAIVALLQEKLQPPADRQVVGLAYAINGNIVNVRWFLAPKLYAGFRQSLIETIADDTLAVNADLGAEKIAAYEKSPKAVGAAEFHQFMQVDRQAKKKRDAAANSNTYYESPAAYSAETVGKEGELKDKALSIDFTAK